MRRRGGWERRGGGGCPPPRRSMGARRPLRPRADRAAGSRRRSSTRRPASGARAGSRRRRRGNGWHGAGLRHRAEAFTRPRRRRGVVRRGVGDLRPLAGVPGRDPLGYGSRRVCRRSEAVAGYRIGATASRGRGREAGSMALVCGEPTPRW